MSRCCLASTVIVLAGFLPAQSRDDPGDKLVGTWVWRTPPDGNDQYFSIGREGGKWTVKGWYKNDKGVETGSFVGVDPGYSDGVLRYTHRFVKKHFNYKDNVPVMIKVDGEQVKYFWNANNPKSERLLQKVNEKKAGENTGDKVGEKAANPFAGTWKGKLGNLDQVLIIKKSNGTWSVNGKLYRNGAETGSFIGTDIKEVNGTLTFHSKYVKKPANTPFSDGSSIVVKSEGENLTYSWSLGDQKGTRALEKVAEVEKPTEATKPGTNDLGKFQGYWTADVATGFRVVMLITMKDGKIDISANYYRKNGAFAGSFVAVDPTFKDGNLTFTQDFVKKPVNSWQNGKFHTLRMVSDNVLKFSWRNGGTEQFTRLKK